MSRLQKKCLIGSGSLHLLLLLALLVGPAFFNRDKVIEMGPVLTFEPMMASDKFTGGGAPKPPASAAPQTQREETPPQAVQREETQQKPDPQPVRREPPKTTLRNDDAPPQKKVTPKKHEVALSNKRVKLGDRTSTKPSPSVSTQARSAANQLAKEFSKAGKSISSNLSPTTQVDMPEGPGGGGFSYATYAEIVRKRYTDAWLVSDNIKDDEAVARVSVVIKRDGSVFSANIVRSSGSPAVDQSIQNALNRVNHIGVPFPAGARESQRTFTISFSLKAKRYFG